MGCEIEPKEGRLDANAANPSPGPGMVGTGDDISIAGFGFTLVRRVLCRFPTFSVTCGLEGFFALLTGLVLGGDSCLTFSNG